MTRPFMRRAYRTIAGCAVVGALSLGAVAVPAPVAGAAKTPVVNAPGYPPPQVLSVRLKFKHTELRVHWRPPSKKPPYTYMVRILADDGVTVLAWGVSASHSISFEITPEMSGTRYAQVTITDQYGQSSVPSYTEFVCC